MENEPTERCGRTCGQSSVDERWDDSAARVTASPDWPLEGFLFIEKLVVADVLETHEEAANYGRTTARGLAKQHFLKGIWDEYQQNIRDRIDPIYIASRWVKHSVMHRPFRDANRRTAFLWSTIHFAAFGYVLRVDTPHAIQFKTRVRNESFAALYEWFEIELKNAKNGP